MARYQNAPLRYVAFVAELRAAAVLGEPAALDAIHAELRDVLPVREDAPRPPMLHLGNAGARFVDGAQHRAVFVGPSTIALDTTTYTTFSEFVGLLGRVMTAVTAVAPGRACQRLGLRYVDEIRIPNAEPASVEQWRGWISEALIPPVAFGSTAVGRDISGAIEDDHGDGFGVRFTWHTGTGHIVAPAGPLIVPNPSPHTPYFALDTDSYWNFLPGAEVLAIGDPKLMEYVERLHDPVHEFFEKCLTERLRSEILIPIGEPK